MSGLRRFYRCTYELKECYMPSQRTILADITDLKLDPSRAHRHTSVSGRLKKVSSPSQEEITVVAVESIVSVVEQKSEVVEEVVAQDFTDLDVALTEVVTEVEVQNEPLPLRSGLVELSPIVEESVVQEESVIEEVIDSTKKPQKKKKVN